MGRYYKVIIFLTISAVSVALAVFLYLLKPINARADFIPVSIPSNSGFWGTVKILKENNLIRSRPTFVLYSVLSGAALRFKAGDYLLSQSMGAPEIIARITKGPREDIPILIIEGATIGEIDDLLSHNAILQKNALKNFEWQELKNDYPFLKEARSLEGFLFPDTYRFFIESTPEKVVRKFLDNFKEKALPLFKNEKNLYNKLILASLIEKEVPFSNDRLIVSGVLHNRLRIGMPLQVDAAPWTYENYGLPPEPIANPGLDAIKAALNPADTDYLYYLSDPKTKKTIFSKTLDEHNEKRWRYLKK